MSCGVGDRCSSDSALLWLWFQLVAIATTRLLAWELPYATGAAFKKAGKKKKKKARNKTIHFNFDREADIW